MMCGSRHPARPTGADAGWCWLAFEPDPGRRVRAELLDEGLDVLTGLGGRWVAGRAIDAAGGAVGRGRRLDPPATASR
ncbi:MAG TPA: hypothetical protein VK453_01050 [Micromonosporaceae bacterium]|nr:hypothetical protein [Micromonosporaceae bacterium]